MPKSLQDHLTETDAPVPERAECPSCHNLLEPFALFEQEDATFICGQCLLDDQREGAPAPGFTWDDFRAMRSQKLAECDWTQLVDVPVETRDLWQPYRDALRDAPAAAQAQLDAGTIASLIEFEWPAVPAEVEETSSE